MATARKTTVGKKKAPHKHRARGVKMEKIEDTAPPKPKRKRVMPKGKAINSMMERLADAQEGTTKSTTKGDKPLVTIEGRAADLLWLLKAKAQYKDLESKIKAAEAPLLEDIEKERIAICKARQEYIGSINVAATGDDENGKPIDAGVSLFFRQNRHTPLDYYLKSKDDELQKAYEGKANLRHEAISAIADALIDDGEDLSYEDVEVIFDARMETDNSIVIKAEVLAANPEIFDILEESGLLKHTTRVSKAKPSETFYKQSNWDARERTIMHALQGVGFCKQAKATLKK